jgi:hypothetical protein
MNKTIAAMCVGLLLAAAVGPASARTKHHRHAEPVAATQSHINSGWGPPRTWDEIEVSHSEGAQQ